jgi:hypothetical protein
LGCLVCARADAAVKHDLAHPQREVFRRLMPALSAFHVPDLEGRLLSRPEGENNERSAFPKFLTAGFTNRGPFPERKIY